MWSNISQLRLGNIREYSPIFKTTCVAKKIWRIMVKRMGRNYLVNKPLQAAGILAERLSSKFHICPQVSLLSQMFIFRTISQLRTLSADIHVPTSQKGVYLLYNPPINFHFAIKPLVNMVKKKPVVISWRMCMIDVWELSKFDWFN